MELLESRRLLSTAVYDWFEGAEGEYMGAQGAWAPESPLIDANTTSVTLTLTNLPAHTALNVNFGTVGNFNGPPGDVDSVTASIDGHPMEVMVDPTGGGGWGNVAPHTDSTATVTISGEGLVSADDDWQYIQSLSADVELLPTVSVSAIDAAAAEGTPVTDTATARFTRSGGDMNQPLTVQYAATDRTTTPSDYNALSGEVTFGANQTTADVVITPVDDDLAEGIESLAISALPSANYTVFGVEAIVEVADNDAQFRPDPADGFVEQNPPPSKSTMKVSAGETVTLHTVAQDQDQKSVDGVTWQNVDGEGPYECRLTIAGKAKFDNGQVQMVVDGLDSGNIKVKTDVDWTANDPAITVTLTLVDKGERDRRDSNKTANWTLQRRTTAPTTMTTAGNQQVNQWVDVTHGALSVTYNMGPDLNSDNKPDYAAQSVQESFSSATDAYGFTLDDLTDAWKQAHGNPATVSAAAELIFTSGRNATFVIDDLDQITDANQGAAIDTSAFKPHALDGKTIGCKMVQTYTVTDPNDPNKLSLSQSYNLLTKLVVDANSPW